MRLHHSIYWYKQRWRPLAILVFFVIGWAVTIVAASIWRHRLFETESTDTLRDIFVAWTGELIFFTIVGLAVSIISIERSEDPESRKLTDRIKILLGAEHASEGLVLYCRDAIVQNLAVYSKRSNRIVQLEKYDSNLDAFLVRIRNTYVMCNALRDTATRYDFRIGLRPDKFPDPSFAAGRVLSMSVDGENRMHRPLDVTADGLTTSISIEMAPLAEHLVEVEYEIWWLSNVDQRLRCRSYTEYHEATFLNRLNFSPVIEIRGPAREHISLLYNQPTVVATALAATPEESAFTFGVLTPKGAKDVESPRALSS